MANARKKNNWSSIPYEGNKTHKICLYHWTRCIQHAVTGMFGWSAKNGIYHSKYWKCVICIIHIHIFIRMWVCIFLHFLKSWLCLEFFLQLCFVRFYFYLLLVVWFAAVIACVHVLFRFLSTDWCDHAQISNCTHFI